MTMTSIGDMAQQFISRRNGSAIKTDLASLVQSMSTGRVTDLTKELGAETARFSGIVHSLAQLESYERTNRETAQKLSGIQIILGQVDQLRGFTAERLLPINESSTRAQIGEAALASRSAFETVVRTLNTQIADRALLSGKAVDQPPLASADDMLSDLVAVVGGTTDPAAISAAVASWFDDPNGGFATMGYLGDRGSFVENQISENQSVAVSARADDPALIEVLQATALAALASELPGVDLATKAELLLTSGKQLFVASSDLVALQARVGFTEQQVANAMSENAAQETSLGILRNELVSADPFETASKLQAVQLQLETHFAVTARMSQLSLLRYI